MLNSLLIAGLGTLVMFFCIEFIKSVRQFAIFKKVRETLLESIVIYLKETPYTFVDLNVLREKLLLTLIETHQRPWVDDIRITWASNDTILFVFEMNFPKLKPKYKFIVGLKDVQKIV